MPKNRTLYFYVLITVIVVLLFSIHGFSQEIPKKKYNDKAVQDYINLLSANEQRLLNTKLKNYADTTSTGIAIAIRNDIKDDIDFYAARMLTKWGLGQKGKDNGILLVLDTGQRKIAISTGYGVEHLLTDALSKRIIENIITPEFKKGNFYKGLDKGTSAIMQVMSGEYQGTSQGNEGIPIIFIILFFIILMIILSNRNGRRGGNGRNATDSIFDTIILSNSGRSGGGFGGSSGGGFGGSSGGGFGGFGGGFGGGGGASGGW